MEKIIITNFLEDILEFTKINKNFTIYTKNNFIYEKFKNKKELKCIHIESLIENDEFNEYTKKSTEFIEYIAELISSKNIINKLEIDIFKRTMLNSFFTLIHHYVLMSKIIALNNHNEIYVYSTNFPKEKNNINIEFERYDNLFSYLSHHVFYRYIKNININKYIKKSKEYNIFQKTYLKFLNILSLDFDSLLGKIKLKILLAKKFNSNKFIYGDNTIFPYIIKRNSNNFINLEKLKFDFNESDYILEDKNYDIEYEILEYFEKNFPKYSQNNNFIKLFVKKIYLLLNTYQSNKEKINSFLEDYIAKNSLKGSIYTNGFFREIEKFFYFKLKEHNILVYAFEHGITYGVSYSYKFYKDYYALIYSDIKILRSGLSENIQKIANFSSKEILLGSPPNQYNNFFYKFTNKYLAKIILGLNPMVKYISMSIPVDKNNFIYGPNRFTDYENLRTIKIVINFLLDKYKNHKIIIKRYEFDRYIDNDYLEEIFKNNKRVIVRKIPDYKFYLKICDFNYTTVSTSTLEFMKNRSFQSYYLSFKQNKLNDNFESKGEKIIFNDESFKIINLNDLNFDNNWSLKELNKLS